MIFSNIFLIENFEFWIPFHCNMFLCGSNWEDNQHGFSLWLIVMNELQCDFDYAFISIQFVEMTITLTASGKTTVLLHSTLCIQNWKLWGQCNLLPGPIPRSEIAIAKLVLLRGACFYQYYRMCTPWNVIWNFTKSLQMMTWRWHNIEIVSTSLSFC